MDLLLLVVSVVEGFEKFRSHGTATGKRAGVLLLPHAQSTGLCKCTVYSIIQLGNTMETW
jgi:hypothetical protein